MRNPLTILHRKRTSSLLRFWSASRPRRLFAGAAIVLSLVLGAGILAAGPARAVDVGSSGLSVTFGHTCRSIGYIATDEISNGAYSSAEADFCIELGIYTSSSGVSSVVAEVQGICKFENGLITPACSSVNGAAAAYTPAYSSAGSSIATSFSCSGNCKAPRTFFYPLVTTNLADNGDYLQIWANSCVDNVWAVVFEASAIELPDYNHTVLDLTTPNLGTPHFNVCKSSSGAISWTQIS